jgi:hypothetical protein
VGDRQLISMPGKPTGKEQSFVIPESFGAAISVFIN